jgi:uncharacterized protein (TIGR02598 family)
MGSKRRHRARAFSLVEVVLAIGVVSFSVLATIGLLSVATDTQKRAKDDIAAARITDNEFSRLRSLSASSTFWSINPPTYTPQFYDSDLKDTTSTNAIYELRMTFSAAPTGTADLVANAEVRYPAQAPTANQNIVRFTTLMNRPIPTPTPSP